MDRPDRIDREGEERPVERFREFLESLSDEARDLARRKPLEGLFLAFIVGVLFGGLLGRNR